MLKSSIKRTALAGVLTTLFSSLSFAAAVVVVHPDNNAALSVKDVQRIFLGKEKKFSDGKETLPINQAESSAIRAEFDSELLGRSSTQVAAYWSKLVFTGKGIPPKEVNDDAAVLDIIMNNKNAIGYIDESAVTNGVKVVPLN
ncbi:phosphate ABC transporter substrate-binding protein [Aliiglaciecola sp. LCG003]|uniref:phosphate ABC transporter substrate-binding protein n=1 Tax=Aliiglaciecola sp. LCG003 TaxID=3053655 RepID=UPI002572CE98|nr:phosphate ABC transporter substrate-binding protein [Aliiglaciecola sp. LCG003]WJG08798.1 phosphate ABC transporter substrate-binding protein [Aliiglaciecola sp. LCG003]